MAKKLYVGNLQWKIGFEQLQELFSQAGQVVSATVIADRYSGRSKGFGFVEMATDEEAEKAKEMFNGKEFEGRTLVVNDAKPKRDDDSSQPVSDDQPVDDQSQPADDQMQQPDDQSQPVSDDQPVDDQSQPADDGIPTADDIVGAPEDTQQPAE